MGVETVTDRDRWALHNAASVLASLQKLIDADEDLARKLYHRLETPNGDTVRHFWLETAAASGRNQPDSIRKQSMDWADLWGEETA